MKKLLLVAALFTLSASFAEEKSEDKLTIKKGTWFLVGNLSLGFNRSESEGFQSSDSESKTQNFNFLLLKQNSIPLTHPP
ncbi:hypothetical protein [Pricia sp.]|uniref:hypothetical protein n=1 Tax=Pricia sp. TaxID=2268138 RepID=UPI003592FB74